jgi:prepilin-type N-terminal cleavage/methylation domain-containing protein
MCNHWKQRGFTLLEMLIVFGLMAVLSAIGFASYSSFNGSQSVQSGASDVSNLMNTAKSRSISQVKPTQCAGKSLSGYQVQVTVSGGTYMLNVLCGGSTYLIETRKLPTNVTFAAGSTPFVTFMNSSGTPTALSTMTVSGNGKTKVITVSSTGTIMTN